jgi:hypothetical protein
LADIEAEKERIEKLKKELEDKKKKEAEDAAKKPPKKNDETMVGNDTSTWTPEDVKKYNTHPHESISKEQQEAEEEEK